MIKKNERYSRSTASSDGFGKKGTGREAMYGKEKEAFDVTEPCLTLKRRGNTGSVFRQL